MPARVHAILVARPDARLPAASHLRRTLTALGAQTRPVERITLILCGADTALRAAAAEHPDIEIITAPAQTRYADALRLADSTLDGEAVWLLAQDTVPSARALAVLADALDRAPSVAVAAPKLVRLDDPARIVSLGQSMTRGGRAVELAADEFDQGQHDGADDVLGADVRGILIRRDAWAALGGLDPALAGADEGLDLGVRAHLAGGRVSMVPAARIAVAGDGVAGLRRGRDARTHRTYAARRAQLQRRLAYASPLALPFLWLLVLPTAVWRTAVLLVAKTPSGLLPEWGASVVAFVRVDSIARARARIRRSRSVPWALLAPLRLTPAQARHRLDGESEGPVVGHPRTDLRFFSGGGAWAVLAALILSVAMFPALLAWRSLAGGALQPLSSTVSRLWADAAYGLRPLGLHEIAPADPFSAVVAVIGSVLPTDPSRALVVLWLLALPLAVLGGWFAMTRITDRPLLRISGGVAWALAPPFLAALSQGRPTAVILHLLLPWLLFAAAVAHRSWSAAGGASLLLVASLACAPSLAPAFAVLWVLAVVLTAVLRPAGTTRVVWTIVPAVVFAVPLVWRQLRTSSPWALVADPGVPWAGPQVGDSVHGRFLLATGFPTTDPGGWGLLLHELGLGTSTWWVPVLVLPVAVFAVLAPFTRRRLVGVILLVVAALGIGTAIAAVGIAAASVDGQVVRVWAGSGLSLAWAGGLGAALLTLDAGLVGSVPDSTRARRLRALRGAGALVMVAAILVVAVPQLTAHLRGVSSVTEGAPSTLPAYVAAAGRGDPDTGTLVIAPLGSDRLGTTVVWGESETIGGQSTVWSTRTRLSESDRLIATLSTDLVSSAVDKSRATDPVRALAAQGIGYVLLERPADESAQPLALSSTTVMNQRAGMDAVGEVSGGTLWRITETVTARAEPGMPVDALSRGIALAEIIVVAAALLLAVPTAESLRRTRREPRIVGLPAPSKGGVR
ncbi:glycosyl transferase [Microbacterium mangrovi]|uniref:Glycosyl transferase n=1 Tax=Microbacterium mangrovi TaxID=1348253 RepID=A0A0B2AAV8_9MICO|nr:glycosyltransferase [Microbacterium mangrovi]KHK98913.1 glycosyl transferase [Microbacterium mangrovi]